MRIRYTGINHLAMATGDIDRTIRFWRDLLEMPLIVSLGRAGYRHYFFQISEQDAIAFFEWPEVEPMALKDHGVPVQGRLAFDHLAIAVESDAELWKIRDRLEAAGFWVSEPIDHGFIHSVYSFDPNNIPIEFSAPVPGVDPRKTPFLKDSHPSEIAREGSAPQPGHWPKVTQPTPADQRQVFPGEGRELVEDKKG